MTLPASGAISLNNVNVELGLSGTTSINMNQASVRTLFGVASGAISMSDGYGKSNTIAIGYTVVAGGGGGGNVTAGAYRSGGGGGAGALRFTTANIASGAFAVTVGGGGGSATNGTDSSFNGLTSTGGGYCGPSNTAGNSGGSGGGGARGSGSSRRDAQIEPQRR